MTIPTNVTQAFAFDSHAVRVVIKPKSPLATEAAQAVCAAIGGAAA